MYVDFLHQNNSCTLPRKKNIYLSVCLFVHNQTATCIQTVESSFFQSVNTSIGPTTGDTGVNWSSDVVAFDESLMRVPHPLVRVYSDVLVAFLYFDICHYRQSNLAIENPEFSQPVVAGHFQ